MARKNDSIFFILSRSPWWVSVLVSATLYVFLRFVLPAQLARDATFGSLAPLARSVAWIALVLLIPGAWSALDSWRKRNLLDEQSGIESIRSLSWREFEELLAEAYRRQGYSAEENTSAGPDGGVDIRLRKGGELVLVQCKQWRAYKVGVNVVREMLGLMTAERAAGGIVVTSGAFTEEARGFAEAKPITLVEGDDLDRMIGEVQTGSPDRTAAEETPSAPAAAPAPGHCPRCGKDLVIRTARRGGNAGTRFLGCSSFPLCKYAQAHKS